MTSSSSQKTAVFLTAEIMANDLSLLPDKRPRYFDESSILGLLSRKEIEDNINLLKNLDVDSYIQQTVTPSENPKRRSAPEVIRTLGGKLVQEELDGPLYIAEMEFVAAGRVRRLGFIAQNRKSQSGVWYPHHHYKAAERARFFASHGMPLVTFMDTPGAAADAEANLQNQSQAISFLIAEMANLQLPTVGVVFGAGYSGGAIPLATTNILLSLRDAVFNTIHPKGLSQIARKYNLSWQECAKYIGISAYELYTIGYFDGVINFTPEQQHLTANLTNAILSSIECVENNAKYFLRSHEFFFEHYRENIEHYLNPSEMLIEDNKLTDKTPTGILNIFGSVYRFSRYLKLRKKITSQSVLSYSRLSNLRIPEGKLQERLSKERQEKFQKWIKSPLEVRYHEDLFKKYRRFVEASQEKASERSKIAAFFMGDPKENFENAVKELTSDALLYLYNYWKENTLENLVQLYEYIGRANPISSLTLPNPTLLNVLLDPPIRESFQKNFQNIILFDLLYNGVVESLPLIAGELKGTNQISQASVEKLFETAFEVAIQEFDKISLNLKATDAKERFFKWLARFVAQKNCDQIMRTISDWKRLAFPRLSPPLFGLVRYYFATLLPALNEALQGKAKFDGKITPRNIGIKDFWNRLDRAYKDLLIQNLLREYKKNHITPRQIIDYFFTDFQEFFHDRMTADPVRFPGFRHAIEQALTQGIPACGVLTGLAMYQDGETRQQVGLIVSNTLFQAGAFDMASGEKVCRLLAECTMRKLPVIMFISSGGMQTKEGSGSLFCMAVINDRLTRFVKDNDLPVICFGFRDCVGGAQASFVTHRLVKTYYMSGTTMSFAGQLVVESHLPATATLSNYLSELKGSMAGLVHNPFDEAIDGRLKQIDPQIPLAQLTIREVISRILAGEYRAPLTPELHAPPIFREKLHLQPIRRLLIHARGCTATRLIHASHALGIEVVLVQSDADMESYPTQLLQETDRLICIGGNTPQESYLNAMSVILIAEQEQADAIHPGIGFLSESPAYAKSCREHGLNFIGPRALSMDLMGNKSNAIATAIRLKVPVVPGSQGALADPTDAQMVADEIGYPVLIKATHGGGGRGICVVPVAEEFPGLFARMSQEALNAFGNGDLYLEKYITSMRHLEVQVLRDSHGHSKLLGVRDCTVQRNYQKLIEEYAGPHISTELTEQLYRYAKAIIDDIDYLGAGTIEFLYDRHEKKAYFMEMNTRLQVEHPVSEMVTDVDLVKQQLAVASGESIADLEIEITGHAMELRITAEKIEVQADGSLSFLPDPGEITGVVFPITDHIRVISAVTTKSVIPPFYDSMIAQIIAWAPTREEVIERLLAYLERVRINGVFTNLALMRAILSDPIFQAGEYDTGFIKEFLKRTPIEEIMKQAKQDAGASLISIDQKSIMMPDSEELKVLSPQTGVFYRANAPSDPPFVEEGQIIECSHVLCLLESMKLFNEVVLESYKTGEGDSLYDPKLRYQIKRIFAEDRQTVSRGDLLFVIQPVLAAEAS